MNTHIRCHLPNGREVVVPRMGIWMETCHTPINNRPQYVVHYDGAFQSQWNIEALEYERIANQLAESTNTRKESN